MHCPSCGGSDIRESHSHGVRDRILEIFGLVAYRCRACRSRFYRRPPEDGEPFEDSEEARDHEPDVDTSR